MQYLGVVPVSICSVASPSLKEPDITTYGTGKTNPTGSSRYQILVSFTSYTVVVNIHILHIIHCITIYLSFFISCNKVLHINLSFLLKENNIIQWLFIKLLGWVKFSLEIIQLL